MLTRARILELIPHKGTMCLLDEAVGWSDAKITCRARSHLSPDNPLRRNGGLAGLCGIEYGLQAAALHGAIVAGGPQPAGYLAALVAVTAVAVLFWHRLRVVHAERRRIIARDSPSSSQGRVGDRSMPGRRR